MNVRHLASLLILVSLPAFAGQSVRNGGAAVVCHPGTRSEKIALLDEYEAYGDKAFSLHLQGSNVDEKLSQLLNRMARLSPQRAQAYRAVFPTLFNPTSSIDGIFPSVNDTGPLHRVIEDGCELQQAAIQVPRSLQPSGRNVLINAKLYAKMSEDTRAALLMHELIYMELANWGTTESSKLRSFTAFLSSPDFDKTTASVFIQKLYAAGFATYEYGGLSLSFVSDTGEDQFPTFYDADHVRSATPVFNSDFTAASQTFHLAGHIEFAPSGLVNQIAVATSTKVKLNSAIVEIPDHGFVSLNENLEAIATGYSEPEISNSSASSTQENVKMVKTTTFTEDADGKILTSVVTRAAD